MVAFIFLDVRAGFGVHDSEPSAGIGMPMGVPCFPPMLLASDRLLDTVYPIQVVGGW